MSLEHCNMVYKSTYRQDLITASIRYFLKVIYLFDHYNENYQMVNPLSIVIKMCMWLVYMTSIYLYKLTFILIYDF